ncbi:MAG: phosphoglycerate kinase [Clostridiales bacterium]|nr:phosphoglycerate kinase [Clostridiales bacterium]
MFGMEKKTLRDIDVFGKKVLMRVDFNVPMADGKITDDNRIVEALPSIKYIIENGGSVILMSHLGRPDGKVVKKYSLKPVAKRLAELLDKKVIFAKDVVGVDASKKAKELKQGQILLLENLRFDPAEEENGKVFCNKLAKMADIYVNDAFGTAHRKHASTYGVAKQLPSAVGFLIEKELTMICDTMANPKRPLVGILGGAKVADKLPIIDKLIDVCDTLIIGGGMAYTFLKAQGYTIGTSLVDDSKLKDTLAMLDKAKEKGVNLLLPQDFVVSTAIDGVKNAVMTKGQNIPEGMMGVDIGNKTIKMFSKAIKKAKTVIWNGPLGVFEQKEFANGTFKVAKAVSKVRGTTIIGGGDSGSAIIQMGLADKITHISTGGGASLKLFEGKVLPGVDIIENKTEY